MRRPAVIALVAGAVLSTVVLAACTSNSGNGAQSSDLGAKVPAAAQSSGASTDYAGSAPLNAPDAATPPSTTGSLISDTRSVIRKADMTVTVRSAADVAAQANRADALVTKAGGEVFGDSRDNATTGHDATATLTLKVPPAALTSILNELSQLGKEESRSLSSEDVTTQVADVNARLASASASIARLRTLYSSATKVTDVIAIESELASREADLESLEAQQRALTSETSMATVTLVLTTVATPVVTSRGHHYSGIGGAFANGWHHFLIVGSWLVTALTTVVPIVVLIALLAGAGLWLWRRRRTAAPTPVTE